MQGAVAVSNHCPFPTRAGVAVNAPLGPANYARMFPELPPFEADEQFLHALGSAGGYCDCGKLSFVPEAIDLGLPAAGS